MPGNYPYSVQKDYMEASVEVWRRHTDVMLHDIFQKISNHLKALVENHFASFGRGRLVWYALPDICCLFGSQYLLYRNMVGSHIGSRCNSVRKTLRAALDREIACSLVYGRSEYFHYKNTYHNLYRSQHPSVESGQGVLRSEEEHGIRIMAETRAFYHGK
jgi:hypothetical protein